MEICTILTMLLPFPNMLSSIGIKKKDLSFSLIFRYFLCKVIFPSPDESNEMLTSQEFRRAIEKAAREIFGEFGLGIVGNRLRGMPSGCYGCKVF